MTGLTTVYRSADGNAEVDATAVRDRLVTQGIAAELFGDKTAGVVPGTWEVRVPEAQADQAETLIAEMDQDDPGAPDPSHDLDLVTLRRLMGTTSEVEAYTIKGILESNGINAVIVGNSTLPNLSFFVKVAKNDLALAEAAIDAAEAAGPAAAVEAERESEGLPPEQQV